MKRTARVGVAVTVGLLACAVPVLTQSAPGTAKFGRFGLDLTSQKQGVKPGDDFWTYANGAWDARTEIAPDRASAGVAVTSSTKPRSTFAASSTKWGRTPDSTAPRAGRLATSTRAGWTWRGSRRAARLRSNRISTGSPQRKTRPRSRCCSPRLDYASPVNLGIIPSLSNPTQYTAVVGQGGLGMPRDNYLLPGEKYEGYRAAYRAYVERIQTLAGIRDASAKADAIVTLETAMAKDQWSPEESRNIAKLNDPQTIDGLKAKAPEFDWVLMVKTAGLSASPTVLMTQNTALIAMGKIFAATPVDTWQAYLAYHFISDHAQYLPKAFDEAKFDFFAKTLAGVQAQRERWKRGVQLVNGAPRRGGRRDLRREVFPARGREADGRAHREPARRATSSASPTRPGWTKRPRRPRSRSSRRSSRASATRSNTSTTRRSRSTAETCSAMPWPSPSSSISSQLQRLPQTGRPDALGDDAADRERVLQPALEPDHLPGRDPAAAVLRRQRRSGGELRRDRRDDRPRDGPRIRRSGQPVRVRRGSSRTGGPTPKKAFKDRTAALTAQYDVYEPVPGTHINGGLTLGENIGDLGGIEAAYAAFQRYQAQHGKAAAIDGLTGDQRFFLAYAQAWQSKAREGALRQQLITDPHSPAKYRTNGVVRNVDAWYAAFDVKPGDALYLPPDQRVHIW